MSRAGAEELSRVARSRRPISAPSGLRDARIGSTRSRFWCSEETRRRAPRSGLADALVLRVRWTQRLQHAVAFDELLERGSEPREVARRERRRAAGRWRRHES